MKYTYCKGCGQPVRPGVHKPGEFEHAQGCPVKEERDHYAKVRRERDKEAIRKRRERNGHRQ